MFDNFQLALFRTEVCNIHNHVYVFGPIIINEYCKCICQSLMIVKCDAQFNGMPCLRNGAYPGCAGCAQIINQKKKANKALNNISRNKSSVM